MADAHEFGRWAETRAVDWLVQKGFRIVARNWRFRHAEIDIIAFDGPVLVFVEVKGRTGLGWGDPGERIDARKKRLVVDAGLRYMSQSAYHGEIRFDIVTILGSPETGGHVRHYPDAFFPDLQFPRPRGRR